MLWLQLYWSPYFVWPPPLLEYSVSLLHMLRRSMHISPCEILCHCSTSRVPVWVILQPGRDITAGLESLKGVRLGIDQRIWIACQECLHRRLAKQLIALLQVWGRTLSCWKRKLLLTVCEIGRTCGWRTSACKCAPNNNNVCILRSVQSKHTITLPCYTTLSVTFFSMSIVLL